MTSVPTKPAPASARIIDANLNRLTEGLRVVEDIIRFGLEDRALLARVRNLRNRLSRRLAPLRRAVITARSSTTDPGRGDRFDRLPRKSLDDVLLASFKRAEEAARVLEELFKLERCREGPAYVRFFKRLRFTLYALEKQTLLRLPPPQA